MKIGIISDIHSNLEALEEVLKDIEKRNVDKIVCLGDIVGYGANPNECCEIVRRYVDFCVLGNHDAATIGMIGTDYFRESAKIAIEWTKKILKGENLEWLRNLPLKYQIDKFIFTHGAPYSPEDFEYVIDSYTSFWSLQYISALNLKAGFVGHAHITVAFAKKGEKIYIVQENEINLLDFDYLVINVGSVGQPRDRDPRAAYSILDTEDMKYFTFRVEYDIKKASQKILSEGLPPSLSQRLFLGR